MKIKYIVVFAFTALLFEGLNAQQEGIFSQYWTLPTVYNPATVGVDGTSHIALATRQQWSGITDAPTTYFFAYSRAMGKNVGLGLSLIQDKTFIEKSTFISIDFSYKLKFNEDTSLYLGLKGGGNNYSVNTAGLQTYNILFDPALESFSRFLPNVGVGFSLHHKSWELNVSVPRMLNTERYKNDRGRATQATDRPHFYLGLTNIFDLSNQIALQPRVFARIVEGAPSSYDFNTMVIFKEIFNLGGSYRTDQSYSIIAEFNLIKHEGNNLTFGWGYEKSTRATLADMGETHEFALRYNF